MFKVFISGGAAMMVMVVTRKPSRVANYVYASYIGADNYAPYLNALN